MTITEKFTEFLKKSYAKDWAKFLQQEKDEETAARKQKIAALASVLSERERLLPTLEAKAQSAARELKEFEDTLQKRLGTLRTNAHSAQKELDRAARELAAQERELKSALLASKPALIGQFSARIHSKMDWLVSLPNRQKEKRDSNGNLVEHTDISIWKQEAMDYLRRVDGEIGQLGFEDISEAELSAQIAKADKSISKTLSVAKGVVYRKAAAYSIQTVYDEIGPATVEVA